MSCFSKKEEPSEPLVATEEAELRIVLLGKVGVGKSASGNSILGGDVFPSQPSLSVITTKCQKQSGSPGTQNVVVVDTPGLFNPDRTNEEVVREIKKSVSLANGPHVFLIVLKMSDKFTDEDKDVVEVVCSTFGKTTMDFTGFLFTYGDALRGTLIEDFIRSNGNLFRLITQCGWRYQVFDNKAGDPDQVPELLKKVRGWVEARDRPCYTAEMLRQAETTTTGPGGVDLASIQTRAFAGMGVGGLMGYLAGGGQLTPTIAAVVGGVAGGILVGVGAVLVNVTRNKKCCKK